MGTVFQKQMNQFFEPLPTSSPLQRSLDQKRLHAESRNNQLYLTFPISDLPPLRLLVRQPERGMRLAPKAGQLDLV